MLEPDLMCRVGLTLGFRETLGHELTDSSVSPRNVQFVYHAIEKLNQNLWQHHRNLAQMFPDEYFTCPAKCKCCDVRCSAAENTAACSAHREEMHLLSLNMKNKIYTCQRCQENGRRSIVASKASSSKESSIIGLAKFAWSGYVLECPKCGSLQVPTTVVWDTDEFQGVVSN